MHAPSSKVPKQQIRDIGMLLLLQLLFAEESSTQWQWFRSSSHGTSSTAAAMQGASHEGGGGSAGHHEGFEAIPGAIGRLYVPTLQDENHVVRVQCTPGIR